jgi:hypothetical protein
LVRRAAVTQEGISWHGWPKLRQPLSENYFTSKRYVRNKFKFLNVEKVNDENYCIYASMKIKSPFLS